MLERLNFFIDVPLADSHERRQAKILNVMLLGIGVISAITLFITYIAYWLNVVERQQVENNLPPSLMTLMTVLIVFAINRYWSGRIAAIIFLFMLVSIIYFSGDAQAFIWGENMIALAVPILMASLVLHPNSSFFMAGAIGIISGGLGIVESIDINYLGTIIYFAVAMVSWTSSRNLQMALTDLRTINEDLDERVSQRTAELLRTNEKLHVEVFQRKQTEAALVVARDKALEASRLKSQLLARVSHELRTPLGAILGFAEMLRAGVMGDVSEEQTEGLNKIIQTNLELTRIVSDLLSQAQLEANTFELYFKEFSVQNLIAQVVENMEPLANAKGLEFKCEIAPEVPVNLKGDSTRLLQVLNNLVENSVKFTDQGRIDVRVFMPSPDHWALQVQDTGIGIESAAQGSIFDAFNQADASITRKHFGVGLGLSIVQELTNLMGGDIDLESKPGRGSTFTVSLPIDPN